MPKSRRSDAASANKLIVEFGEEILYVDNNILKCKPCNIKLNSARRSNMLCHFKTEKHVRNLFKQLQNQDVDDNDSNDDSQPKSQFHLDFCHALVSANIPIWKPENEAFKAFLEQYTGQSIPHESTIRKM